MGEEIDGIILVTQVTLGSLISKPKLTEKYLKRPPFRFLHDAVMEVTQVTGFAEGLFSTEESDAGQLADKQAKVDFLTKIISCTSFALGQEISVAPGKIVAGLEPEKTNLFLQKLHEAATAGLGQSDQAVQRVLSGETAAGATKEKKKKKEAEPPSSSPPPPPEAAAPPGAPPPSGPSPAEQQAAEEEKRRRAQEKEKRKAEEAAARKAAEEDEKARRKEEDRRAKDEEKRRRQEEQQAQQLAAQQQAALQEGAGGFGGEAGAGGGGQDPWMNAAGLPGGGGEAAQQDFRSRGAEPEEIAARAQALMAGMNGDGAGLASGASLDRPRTAGRKPPKVASKVVSKADVAAAPVEAPTVIGDGDDAGKDDDDDMFLVEKPQVENIIAVKADEGEHHGKLVREILEEKKREEEKEVATRGAATAEKVEDGGQDGGAGGIKMGKLKRKKDQAQQYANIDVLKLRESIQQLCQAANPLGKSIDLVHQDIANMGKELDHWRQETRNAVESYQQERKVTEETLMPLHRRLAELDESIAEMKSRVQNSRARILKNDVQVQNLLESVMASK